MMSKMTGHDANKRLRRGDQGDKEQGRIELVWVKEGDQRGEHRSMGVHVMFKGCIGIKKTGKRVQTFSARPRGFVHESLDSRLS